jgi:hypothetical protein
MKKIILAVCIFALLLSCTCVIAFGNDVDISAMKLVTADQPNVTATDRLELSLDFYILKESMNYINENAENVSFIGLLAEYNVDMEAPNLGEGTEIALTYSGDKVINSKNHEVYTLNFGVFKPEEYLDMLAVRAFIKFDIRGTTYTIASNFSAKKNTFSPYSAVYTLYTDRSSVLNADYPYKTPDGSFSRIADLDPLRKILASTLRLTSRTVLLSIKITANIMIRYTISHTSTACL